MINSKRQIRRGRQKTTETDLNAERYYRTETDRLTETKGNSDREIQESRQN